MTTEHGEFPSVFFGDRQTDRQKKQDLLLEKIFQIFVFLFGPTKCREILRGNKITFFNNAKFSGTGPGGAPGTPSELQRQWGC